MRTKVVTEIEGEPLRFRVMSRTYGQPRYLVDLEAYGGRGKCECIDWQTHKHKLIRNGMEGPETRCWHVEQAREYFLNKMMKQISREAERQHAVHSSQRREWNGE